MTVAAWDGETLSADKQTSFGGLHATTTKVHRIGDFLISGCGNTAYITQMLQWFRDGMDVEKFPAQQRDEKECASMLVIGPGGSVMQYECTPYPIHIENKFWAVGSGRDFAMAAMYLGKTSREAVEIASVLCDGCGNGVDSISL